MALETGNYINDLVTTNPTSTDPKSAGDDHFRLLKTVIKQSLNGFSGSILLTATDTGTAAAHVLTPSTALVGYTPMLCLLYLPAVTGIGGSLTVNVSGLGAKSIKTLAGADPTAGDIVAGQPVLLMYNGTNFITLSGSEFLSKTGNQTLTGTFTVSSDVSFGGNETVTGNLTVNGTTATLPQTTTIGTTTAAELGYVHGVTSGIQAQFNAKGAIAGQTWTGTHDFTNAATTGVTKAPGTNSTDFATCAFVVQQAFLAALPAQGGNYGKYLTTNGTSATWAVIPPPSVIRSARTTNTILAAADSGTLIDIASGTFTQTLTAAATLGSGWYCYIRNSGTGVVTLDPNASESIDGALTIAIIQGQTVLVQCTGTGFTVVSNNSPGDNVVSVNTGNGYGSTNTMIRRYTTVLKNTGTAITYADSATLGASFTINEPGVYSIYASDYVSQAYGASLNSNQLTTAITGLAASFVIFRGGNIANQWPGSSRTLRLSVGDVVRPHCSGVAESAFDITVFSIAKVGL